MSNKVNVFISDYIPEGTVVFVSGDHEKVFTYDSNGESYKLAAQNNPHMVMITNIKHKSVLGTLRRLFKRSQS